MKGVREEMREEGVCDERMVELADRLKDLKGQVGVSGGGLACVL